MISAPCVSLWMGGHRAKTPFGTSQAGKTNQTAQWPLQSQVLVGAPLWLSSLTKSFAHCGGSKPECRVHSCGDFWDPTRDTTPPGRLGRYPASPSSHVVYPPIHIAAAAGLEKQMALIIGTSNMRLDERAEATDTGELHCCAWSGVELIACLFLQTQLVLENPTSSSPKLRKES